jgi:Golgi phosphoprotein 3 (GPP34)
MLLAEEFVLLALTPEGVPARGYTNHSASAVGVTGALLTELSQEGHFALIGGEIHVTGTKPSHPLLLQVLDNVLPHDGKKLKRCLSNIKHSGWSEVVDLMIEHGKLGREQHPLHPTRHPVLCLEQQTEILHRVRAAASSGESMDDRTATLLALAGPCQLLEVVAPDRADRKLAKRRIEEATERVPVADAVKYVVDAAASAAVVVGA